MAPYRPFQAHPLVRGGHAQTLLAYVIDPPKIPPHTQTEQVRLPDGDRLQLHVDESPQPLEPTAPVVLLLHGLGGCSESFYILRLAKLCNDRGWHAIRFNHRTCGAGGIALARGIYHAARHEDLAATLGHLRSKYPNNPLTIVGFSLSAAMILRWLGESPRTVADYNLAGAIAVCPPFDLEACSVALARKQNIVYDQFFARLLRQTAVARETEHELPDTKFPRLFGVRAFDEFYTALHGGFPSRDEYYRQASPREYLAHIDLPTFIIAADDDPIIPAESYRGVKLNSAIHFSLERSGGHMGFLMRKPGATRPQRWMDEAVLACLDQQFDLIDES